MHASCLHHVGMPLFLLSLMHLRTTLVPLTTRVQRYSSIGNMRDKRVPTQTVQPLLSYYSPLGLGCLDLEGYGAAAWVAETQRALRSVAVVLPAMSSSSSLVLALLVFEREWEAGVCVCVYRISAYLRSRRSHHNQNIIADWLELDAHHHCSVPGTQHVQRVLHFPST